MASLIVPKLSSILTNFEDHCTILGIQQSICFIVYYKIQNEVIYFFDRMSVRVKTMIIYRIIKCIKLKFQNML